MSKLIYYYDSDIETKIGDVIAKLEEYKNDFSDKSGADVLKFASDFFEEFSPELIDSLQSALKDYKKEKENENE